ncbi:MAG TPA: metallophosphoesterase family protein [Oculatellaceae cyanobacterium]
MPLKLAVLADTHIPKRAKDLPLKAHELIKQADAIVHAGDVISNEFLDALAQMKPLYAVRGNNDLTLSLPEQLEFSLEGVQIALIHDSGTSKGRGARMKRRFPNADVVIFGHSHIPMNEVEEGLLLFNPGSSTDRRMQPKHTMGMLTIHKGALDAKIVILD